jgi:uncharacterized ferritin-like protein (DUF455 family)
MTVNARQQALDALCITQPDQKITTVLAWSIHSEMQSQIDPADPITPHLPIPGREAHPILVLNAQLPKRSLHTVKGRAALIHALAHIELNAVNLALDIVWRFADLPVAFYVQWLQVAQEEAYHFQLLRDHLHTLDCHYGDLPVHNGLWDMAEKTQHDLLARLALVPRTLEARGLDACPVMRDKLLQAGDSAGAAILDIILRDEIGHVAIGNHWFNWLCTQRGLEPIATYAQLAQQHDAPKLPRPFNLPARRAAGFTEAELAVLQQDESSSLKSI